MMGTTHRPFANTTVALSAGLGLLLPASGGAGGLDTAYRDYGPLVHDDAYLDLAVSYLSARLADQYEQDALIAQLSTPYVDDERMRDVATATLLPSAAAAERTATDFGFAVSGDRSLEDSLTAFNIELATRGDDLFVQVAEAASEHGHEVTNDSFTVLAAILGERWTVEELQAELDRATTLLGASIGDDRSLDRNLVALNDRIRELAAQETMLAAEWPGAITGASFDLYALAALHD